MCVTPSFTVAPRPSSNTLTGKQLKQLLRTWLSPSDPSTNHNIARKVQHKGAAVWFFRGRIFIEWKSTGSLLWIHGKRAFLSAFSSSQLLTFTDFRSGLWEKYHLVCSSLPTYRRNLRFPSSPALPSLKTLRLYVRLDRPSWPISTSTSGISTSKVVTISYFLLYPNFLLPLVLTATFSIAFMRGSKMVLGNPATTFLKNA